ncbi:MAG: SNF2-related protein [Patescibacteria group bacterium]
MMKKNPGENMDVSEEPKEQESQERPKEKEKPKGNRLPAEMFTGPQATELRSVLLAEYNLKNKQNIRKFQEINLRIIDSRFKIVFYGKEYEDSWSGFSGRVSRALQLNLRSKSMFYFLDMIADGKSLEYARIEALSRYDLEKRDRHVQKEQALIPEMFSSDKIEEISKLRAALLVNYNSRNNSAIVKYANVLSNKSLLDKFKITIGDKEYSDSFAAILQRIKTRNKFSTHSPKIILQFLDFLADGKSLEEARANTLSLARDVDKKKRTNEYGDQVLPVELELFSDKNLAVREVCRSAIVQEYNKSNKKHAMKYADMLVSSRSRKRAFKINIKNKDYCDNLNSLLSRISHHYKLRINSYKIILYFLDLLAEGISVKEARVVALSQNERDKERRLKVQKARLGVELFTAQNIQDRAELRTALLAENNKRNNSNALKYEDISLSLDSRFRNIELKFHDNDYVDKWSNVINRVAVYCGLKPHNTKSHLRLLDLLADGRSVEEAKAEVLVKAEEKKQEERLEEELRKEVKNIANTPVLLAQFKVWISIFGSHGAADILYAHNPNYKTLKEEFINGMIGDYLGYVLVDSLPFVPDNIKLIEGRFLENPNLQEGLYTCLVQACSSYLSKHKANPQTAPDILEDFMLEIGGNIPPDAEAIFLDIIVKVAEYFREVFGNWKHPENMIKKIVEGRDFPDTAQLINVLEIKEKHRLLIADRMGVGKSASAIAAKEFLKLRQALIIVPANVIPTWQQYLSVQSEGGYFVDNQPPRVCVIESVEDLTSNDAKQADYIIISQEKLKEEYAEGLKALDADMLIVDEVHKLKSALGIRSGILHDLAKNFESENHYMVLLSGTPAPNKVSDIAGVLKLLYPRRFQGDEVSSIVKQLINGDITDLRALLVPRMQRKTLEEVVKMPSLIEQDRFVELNRWEKEVYDAIQQDDEMHPFAKITLLRQLALNPSILELQPPPEQRPVKIQALENILLEYLQTGRNKIIVIFNGFTEGVTRGNNSVIGQIKLPRGVNYQIIDGETLQKRRDSIQREFNSAQMPNILFLSGDTADVGINLSGAQAVIFYNEPWSKEEKAQQLGRSFRPGLANDLHSDTIILAGSIEEGIYHHIRMKDKAIKKLLLGIELTELEKRLLSSVEKEEEDLEVDSKLAAYYLNSFQNLMAMFRSVKNIGEAKFSEFLAKHGDRYAGNYETLGVRSYQSNVGRLSANIIKLLPGTKNVILDLASGPEMLKSRAEKDMQSKVISLDINPAHFLVQIEENAEHKKKIGVGKAMVAGITKLPVASGSVDVANLALALHYTSFRPSHKDFERVNALCELNRVLKPGGRAIVIFQHGAYLKDSKAFEDFLILAGFEIDPQFTGPASAENFEAQVYCLVKKENSDLETLTELISAEKALANGLKLAVGGKRRSIRDTRRILTEVQLGEKELNLDLNEEDKIAMKEERTIINLADWLKSTYEDLKNIPTDVLRQHKFCRIKLHNRYVLYKNMEAVKGVVLIK